MFIQIVESILISRKITLTGSDISAGVLIAIVGFNDQAVEVQLGLGKLAARTQQLQAVKVSVSGHDLCCQICVSFKHFFEAPRLS